MSQPSCSEYVTAIASADHTSFEMPYSGPGAAFVPFAAEPPKRSMRAWRMFESFARAEPQRASFTARRGMRTTGGRVEGFLEPARPAHRLEHFTTDGHAVGLDLLDDDDIGVVVRSARRITVPQVGEKAGIGGYAVSSHFPAVGRPDRDVGQPRRLFGAGVDRKDQAASHRATARR